MPLADERDAHQFGLSTLQSASDLVQHPLQNVKEGCEMDHSAASCYDMKKTVPKVDMFKMKRFLARDGAEINVVCFFSRPGESRLCVGSTLMSVGNGPHE
jgi:hypothetical protein